MQKNRNGIILISPLIDEEIFCIILIFNWKLHVITYYKESSSNVDFYFSGFFSSWQTVHLHFISFIYSDKIALGPQKLMINKVIGLSWFLPFWENSIFRFWIVVGNTHYYCNLMYLNECTNNYCVLYNNKTLIKWYCTRH